MAAIAPSPIVAPGAVPDYNDRTTFGARVLAWDIWVRDHMVTEIGASIANAYANAVEAYSQAQAAAVSAANANSVLVSNGITVWTSGATYGLDARVVAPSNSRVYRRKVAGAGTTDPATDTANWVIWNGGLVSIPVTANLTATPGGFYYFTGGYTLTMPAVAGLVKDDQIQVANASGLTTGLVDFGSSKVRGRTVPPDGVVRLDSVDTRFDLQWSGDVNYGWI